MVSFHTFCKFGKDKRTVSEYISNIYSEVELEKNSTVRKFRTVQTEGSREVERELDHYNLDVIISVGYRVKSLQGTQFRIWATQRLREYTIKGFMLNDERFKSGNSMNYFNELLDRIREIRLSEKFFYQKIKDIYTTSIDYDPKDERTIEFFKVVQNKLLWAISQQTTAELVYRRVDARLPLMGMRSMMLPSSSCSSFHQRLQQTVLQISIILDVDLRDHLVGQVIQLFSGIDRY